MYNCNYLGNMTIFRPLVFDNEISVLQMVATLTNRINELTDYTQNILKNANDYTDKEIKKLKKYIDGEIESLTKYIDEIQVKIKDDVDNKYSDLLIKLSNLRNVLMKYSDNGDNLVTLETDLKLRRLETLIDEINEDGFRIYNPISGEKNHVQEVVNDIYEMLRFCLTAGKADILEIPVEEFEKYTVEQIELYSNWYFDLQKRYMLISPSTGLDISHQEAINELYGYLQGDSRTVEELEQRGYTVSDRNITEMSAFDMDFHNKRYT